MKLLKDILYNVNVEQIQGSSDRAVSELVFDSRVARKDCVFVAQRGTVHDGHAYIHKAIALGAGTVVCEKLPEHIEAGITYILVQDSNESLAIMASNYFDNPSSKLKLVGITGTNGKTTIATLLYRLFQKAGYRTGLLSTVKVMIDDETFKATHTTPNSIVLNRYLNAMVESGVSHCFMEVSSHGIHQKRTAGLQFFGGVFTNLTHDHLDYHESFAAYRDVKKVFFDQLEADAFALVNADDKNGFFMVQNTSAKKRSYAMKTLADYKGRILENSFTGLSMIIGEHEFWSRLTGSFNAYNLLAVFGVSIELGLDEIQSLSWISELGHVSGRFEQLVSSNGIVAIVDYAHTPDALKNVLETINDIRSGKTKVITVVGCGGDRDKAKRPVMGRLASQLSDQAIFTSDNPRSESPEEIIREMESGLEADLIKKTISISDREQAIRTAVRLASTGDIVLVAGKGHENYQEINGMRTHFDDMEKLQATFNELEV